MAMRVTRGRRAHGGAGAANRLWRRERAREICEAEEELEAPKTAVDGLARFAGEQGRTLFTLPPVADITYDFAELDELVLAYATTIHKSQGAQRS